MLLQKVLASQLWAFVVHSLISKRREKKATVTLLETDEWQNLTWNFAWQGMADGILLTTSRSGAYYTLNAETLNSCLFSTKPWSTRGTAVSHEFAPLSLDWLTDRSRSEGGVESILSILDFTDAVFKAWCCLFNSAVEFSPASMNMHCVVIESTCDVVIDVESANCCGASNRKSGTPSPPWAGVKVTNWRRSLGRGSVCRSVYHHHHHHFFNNNNFIELYKQKYVHNLQKYLK